MNTKLKFWRHNKEAGMAIGSAVEPMQPASNQRVPGNNPGTVIPFPNAPAEGTAQQQQSEPDSFATPPTEGGRFVHRFVGLMNASELTAFFADNYFGLGKHNGAQYKSKEALDLGKQAIISKFQNTLTDLIERRQAKLDRIRSEIIVVEGVSHTMTQQLQLTCEQLAREMDTLHTQINLAADGKGWVLDALNRYQIGFGKGLMAALEFEMLGV